MTPFHSSHLHSLTRPISPPPTRSGSQTSKSKAADIAAATTDPEAGGDLGARDRTPWIETPLDRSANCIRVLRLRPGSGNTPIVCDMTVVSLDTDPYYEVLSYVWGDPKQTRRITVGGVTFNATVNLFNFLRCLRRPNADRHVWADAICIDQSNDNEKSYQIGLMTKVYRQAKEAHVWFGPFDLNTWHQDASHDKGYFAADEFTANMWEAYDRVIQSDLRYFVKQEGFRSMTRTEHTEFERRCEKDVFAHTLNMLNMMAKSNHLYTYPVFVRKETGGGTMQYQANRSWLRIMDVIRWILARPWWSRVWTLQEAVLPGVDPNVHAPPHSFKLSRLLDGIQAMTHHMDSQCCKWFGNPIKTDDRDRSSQDRFIQCRAVHHQREVIAESPEEGMGVPLELVIESIQGRKATEVRDHWFGIFGFLPVQWQEESKLFPGSCTTSELFSQFSKLLYSSCEELTRLDLARRTGPSAITDLPSWAIDLSAQRSGRVEDYSRWRLYDAMPGTKFKAVVEWPDLKTPDLSVVALRVATVQACAERILPDSYIPPDVLRVVNDWLEFYRRNVHPVVDYDAFWRTAFMDRNVQVHWMAKRVRPLGAPRLNDIKDWWRAWNRTNDHRDLGFDRKAGGTSRGYFHYRALKMNVERAKLFLTTQGLPGMGPPDVKVGDEIYALHGCRSLVVMRRVKRDNLYVLVVVGLCFVDKWMYGRALQGARGDWQTLLLY